MKKFIAGIVITWVMLFSIRIVAISTPLNIFEQFSLVGFFIDYILKKSKELE